MAMGRKPGFSGQMKGPVSWAGRPRTLQEDRVFWLPRQGGGAHVNEQWDPPGLSGTTFLDSGPEPPLDLVWWGEAHGTGEKKKKSSYVRFSRRPSLDQTPRPGADRWCHWAQSQTRTRWRWGKHRWALRAWEDLVHVQTDNTSLEWFFLNGKKDDYYHLQSIFRCMFLQFV